MQQRWIDQPASDEDVFDRVLASSSAFLNRHMSIILKAGPHCSASRYLSSISTVTSFIQASICSSFPRY